MHSAALAPPADPFAALNDEQRAAVEHGLAGATGGPAGPLLVIAGAGTGKTMTLAARVARLVLDGADPNRLLLLTFSRRAAHEMERRAGRLLHAALGFRATQQAPALPWSGTFHAIGARLLREHAGAIGLSPQFTIHDRGDAEDQMGWVRQELELAATGKRFPLKGTCLAIYSRVVNSRMTVDEVVRDLFPWCQGWEAELKRLFPAYVDAKQQQQVLDYDDLLLYWQQMMEEPAHRRRHRRALRPRAGRRVPGHQPAAGRHPARPQARRPRPDRGGRRRAVDLLVPRRRAAQHPRLPGAVRAAGARARADAQLPLDAAHPRCLERAHRAGRRALHEGPARRARRREAAARHRGRRDGAGALGGRSRCCCTAKAACR